MQAFWWAPYVGRFIYIRPQTIDELEDCVDPVLDFLFDQKTTSTR